MNYNELSMMPPCLENKHMIHVTSTLLLNGTIFALNPTNQMVTTEMKQDILRVELNTV